MQFENLFAPIKIGSKTAKNRIAFPAHGVPLADFFGDQSEGSAYIAYQAARAKGGSALNIIGSIGCYDTPIRLGPTPVSPPNAPVLIPKLHRLADALHQYGTIGLIQLYLYSEGYLKIPHSNTWGFTSLPAQQESVAEWLDLDGEDLEKKVNLFVKYATLVREGGMDGIEIHACHGDFVQQSWSKWSNQRHDKWGEPLYFVTQIIERVRQAVGKDFVISVRMPGDDFSFNGMQNEDNQKVAQALEETGGVDIIHVSSGCGGASYSYSVSPMYIPAGSISIPLTSGIKSVIKSIPVIATSRINDPALADKAIADGHCDMVGLVRGHMADPEFGNKARQGRVEDIRMCIACNQGCWDGAQVSGCTQNATNARESTRIGHISAAAVKKTVVVVGGGPGGMEAARVAAVRGHEVILFEKDNSLGGQINILSKAPGREEFNQVTRWLTTQINKLGVKVKLGVEATPEMIRYEKPDAVVVATGAKPYIMVVPGSDQPNVVSPSQLLTGEVTAGENVIVFESTGLQEGPTIADFLAEKGKKVELLTYFPVINTYWGLQMMNIGTHIPVIWPRLKRNGVVITPLSTIKEITGPRVTIADVLTGDERVIENVETVVMATGYRPDNKLYKSLKGQFKEIYAIGDCVLPRRSLDAIWEGYNTTFDI
jgi:2,4-dienoyl-CoA reductase-like NADH-dependent reductase (Old Yellow Enzyme family)/NADPH-dependent 2,4-dienoyl-CoA reductase/sulfur reductase-like enzyme